MERLFREVCADPERFRKFDAPARRHFSRDFPCAIISFHGKTGTRLDCGRDAHETASGLLEKPRLESAAAKRQGKAQAASPDRRVGRVTFELARRIIWEQQKQLCLAAEMPAAILSA